uniref:Uncharacterized protein n=1 Tax=Gracilaria spinulosa TaxID=172972 RepID=A0A6C0A9Q6_9FLOR|nr:hypothetical protein [Gracilaria spinulosa]QHS70843.1 hypothetical protein [Gracilaria spinulosa]
MIAFIMVFFIEFFFLYLS